VLRAPGALIWSSSNPAVASVDAQGQVSALAEGDAVITATSGSATASSSVKVYPTTASTGGALIATALAQNRISAEQALTYQVFVLFGDERLPAEFEGPPDAAPSHLLLRELMTTIGSLSTATQDVLRPFLIPPIYVQSWFAQRLGLAASATAAPRPVARPTARPWSRVRWITSRPIGPTGAAMARPIQSACRKVPAWSTRRGYQRFAALSTAPWPDRSPATPPPPARASRSPPPAAAG